MMYKYLANEVEGEVKLLQTLTACETIHHLIYIASIDNHYL